MRDCRCKILVISKIDITYQRLIISYESIVNVTCIGRYRATSCIGAILIRRNNELYQVKTTPLKPGGRSTSAKLDKHDAIPKLTSINSLMQGPRSLPHSASSSTKNCEKIKDLIVF